MKPKHKHALAVRILKKELSVLKIRMKKFYHSNIPGNFTKRKIAQLTESIKQLKKDK